MHRVSFSILIDFWLTTRRLACFWVIACLLAPSPAFRVFEVFEVFAVYVVFKEVEVCAAVRGDVILKMAHNDSIAGEKICIHFNYLRPQESDNIPQHSRTVHNNPQQFTTSQCKSQQQPTIFEAYNFL